MYESKEGRILTSRLSVGVSHDRFLVVDIAPVFTWGGGLPGGKEPGGRGGGGGGSLPGRLHLGHRCTKGDRHGAQQVGEGVKEQLRSSELD